MNNNKYPRKLTDNGGQKTYTKHQDKVRETQEDKDKDVTEG